MSFSAIQSVSVLQCPSVSFSVLQCPFSYMHPSESVALLLKEDEPNVAAALVGRSRGDVDLVNFILTTQAIFDRLLCDPAVSFFFFHHVAFNNLFLFSCFT